VSQTLLRSRFRIACIGALAILVVCTDLGTADEVQLTDGSRYKGLVLDQSGVSVKFKVVFPSGSSMVRLIPRRKIRDLVIDGIEPKPEPKGEPQAQSKTEPAGKAEADQPGRPVNRTPQQVEALIKLAGTTPPDWWGSVELVYPDTLDLAGINRADGWRPDHNLDTYVWERINKHPERWREGARLLHYVVQVRTADAQRRAAAMEMLGGVYFHLLNDWARAAYWYQRAFKVPRRASVVSAIALAECYWRLGSRVLAAKTLRRYGMDMRRPSMMAIMLWCQMGDKVGAMKMAERLIGVPKRAEEGYLAAGHVARYQGRIDEAIVYYRQAAAVKTGSKNLSSNRRRAQESLEATQLLKQLDLSKVADGVHEASAIGYRGPVHVKVRVAGGKITRVEVGEHREDMFYSALINVPERIVTHEGFTGIDAVTGASATGDAVLNAAIKAAHAGQK